MAVPWRSGSFPGSGCFPTQEISGFQENMDRPDCWCASRGLPTCEELAMLELPDVRQRDEFSCGSAVYRCVVEFLLGSSKRIPADPHDGVHPFELEPALRRAGLKTQSGSMEVADLKWHVSQGRPVICLIRVEGGGHWVVVRGVTAKRVHFHDPAKGRVWLTHEQWGDRHSDWDRHGTVYRQHSISSSV